ncbi:MAG: right-handed parallel beta-helix repeat-containing protein, partial [Planctomycetota bacterium]
EQRTYQGGAIYLGPFCTDVSITDCWFSGNEATEHGGAVRTESDIDFKDCLFGGNIANGDGGAIDAYFDNGNPEIRSMLRIDLERCNFTGNKANLGTSGWGGGVHFQDCYADFIDCYLIGNIARNGGAMLLAGCDVHINGGYIDRNVAQGGSGVASAAATAIDPGFGRFFLESDLHAVYDVGVLNELYETYFGISIPTGGDVGGGMDLGGAIVCADTKATIENCSLCCNVVEGLNGSGGAINFYGGFVEHEVKNCLFAGNSASVDGGAISCSFNAKPVITNCTFSENQTDGIGGAIFFDWSSDGTISDSIFNSCNNGAIAEEDEGNTTVKYSVFHDNPDGDYALYDTENQQIITFSGSELDPTNIEADPLFVTGPLDKYYLSQIPAGQDVNSPAVDAGSDLAENLGLSDYTTRVDGEGDEGTVDIGYHFSDHNGIPEYTLTASVAGGLGSIQPTSGTYLAGVAVQLTATADGGWHVAQWSGTYDDTSTDANNYVIMDSDKNITVSFEQVRTLDVPGDYTNIYTAIRDANDGDVIIIAPGVYSYEPGQHLLDGDIIEINNQAITIASTNPEDPCVVAATVIDGRFIMTNVGRDMVLNGLTITNSDKTLVSEMARPTPPPPGWDGLPGTGHMGGGIMLVNNASPTILNCVFDACYVRGPHGANGEDGIGADFWCGNGGWAGWAYGGA